MTSAPDTTSPPAPGRAIRQALLWIVKILVSGGLLYVLLRQVDLGRLWRTARTASVGWLACALLLYFLVILVSSWRGRLLLRAQHLAVAIKTLITSYLVATFFNNFLPSNIGGDVIRIRDTARYAGSKTLAATVVLVDRGIGLLGLVFVAAVGSTMAARMSEKIGPIGPGILWALLAGALAVSVPAVLMPHGVGALFALHQEWVEERIARLTGALAKFRDAPRSLAACFSGAILVQGLLVAFYFTIATSLHLRVPLAHLAIVVPVSLIVQMLPV